MKLLENTKLESLTAFLSNNARDFNLNLRIESYSCKMVNSDKREWKKTKDSANEPQPLSPSKEFDISPLLSRSLNSLPYSHMNLSVYRNRHMSDRSSGSENNFEENGCMGSDMIRAISRRTLFDLVAVLNLSYQDYEFSQTKSESFALVTTIEDVKSKVDIQLSPTVPDYSRIRDQLWKMIDDKIKCNECQIYRYIPGYNNDPFTEDGCIWSFNYFFWNKNLKRCLFFSCRALSLINLDSSGDP
uniref:Repressor of RNA polymerase III transcription MAF1 n=1 Tax=Acrobeloides nanus TaxID=290746 RepID=A0A914C4B8_9BILA